MSELRQVLSFATALHRQQFDLAFHGYLRGDLVALLQLRPGRDDPYAIYERMRRIGEIQPTRLGNWVDCQPPAVQPGATGSPFRGAARRRVAADPIAC